MANKDDVELAANISGGLVDSGKPGRSGADAKPSAEDLAASGYRIPTAWAALETLPAGVSPETLSAEDVKPAKDAKDAAPHVAHAVGKQAKK